MVFWMAEPVSLHLALGRESLAITEILANATTRNLVALGEHLRICGEFGQYSLVLMLVTIEGHGICCCVGVRAGFLEGYGLEEGFDWCWGWATPKRLGRESSHTECVCHAQPAAGK